MEQIDKCVNNNKVDVPDTKKIENYLKFLQEFDITFHIGEIFWPICVQYCWAVFAPKELLYIQDPSQLFKQEREDDGCKGFFVILQYHYVDKKLEVSYYNTSVYKRSSNLLTKSISEQDCFEEATNIIFEKLNYLLNLPSLKLNSVVTHIAEIKTRKQTSKDIANIHNNNSSPQVDDTSSQKNSIIPTHIPLNQILFGPPGTGKTYHAINKARAILGYCKKDKPNELNESKIRNKESKQKEQIYFITFHQSYGYEEFIEGIKPVLESGNQVGYTLKNGIFKEICQRASDDDPCNPYILIIDEINRGNISAIFGELITLIEPSKREGGSEELSVILPYSKEEFKVPKNLYLIGTMNTADRSITLLDVALRRRFEFIEMIPNPQSLQNIWIVKSDMPKEKREDARLPEECQLNFKGNAYNKDDASEALCKILEAINTRIEFLLDREHTIGHAFFFEKATYHQNSNSDWYELTFDNLKIIFKNKIIPLLQEYFYNDYSKIDMVLNCNGMIQSASFQDKQKEYLCSTKMTEAIQELNLEDKKIYSITDSTQWQLEHFVKIYDPDH